MHFTESENSESQCSQGHRSSLLLETEQGGIICLLCLSHLISNPKSPTVHVSYALSQLSIALSHPQFLSSLLTFHSHFLVSPLVLALSSFDDDPIASQILHLISQIASGGGDVRAEFVAMVADRLSSGALGWSRRQVYMVHCLGVLLDYHENNSYVHIKDKNALVFNLVTGLQLPSEEIQGEIVFVLYKISHLQYAYKDDDVADVLFSHCPKLLHLSLEALMKTQRDDVRLNCVALLTVLAQRGFFQNACANDISSMNPCEADNFMQTTEHVDGPPLNILFAEAVKGPLLSSDSQVQISTLELIFLHLSWEGRSRKEIQILVEENIADYVFEILRLSACQDPIVNSCIQVLDLLSTAEQVFKQRLSIGFPTLVPVLHYVAGVPFHPVQTQTLKLIWNCVSHSPGIASSSHIEELGHILTGNFKKHIDGEIGMLPETFTMACSILVTLMQSPLSNGTSNLSTSVQDASRHAILTCLKFYDKQPSQLLHSLYLLKEAYAYSHQLNATDSSTKELRDGILDVCKTHILPWFITALNEMEEEDMVLGILETFHSILLQQSDVQAKEFANILVASSWFSLSFGCLGLFPSEKMKWRVYLMFSSIVDLILGNDFGQPIRDAALHLPSDPMDLLFLLGQKSSHNLELLSCQFAVLRILYASSLNDERIADAKLVLASLEQYIILNGSNLLYKCSESVTMELLVNLYGLYRGIAKMGYQIPYSPEAERILFHLMDEKEWDFLSTRIHMGSLKWLFQQEKICKSLSNLILKLCRCNSSNGEHIVIHRNSGQNIGIHAIGELVASGDNFGATLFVCLLRDLIEDDGKEHDISSVVNIMSVIIDVFPAASDQLSLHGIASAIQNIFRPSGYCSSIQTIKRISKLIFIILRSVHPESLSDDEAWFAVTMKLMDHLIVTVAAYGWTEEGLIIIGILCLILHYSTHQALVEASKTILLTTSVLPINNIISEACSRGPALVDHIEGTKSREALIFVLLVHYFSFRSVQAVLPGTLDWTHLLDDCCLLQPLFFTSIRCHDLCRLMHFGCPLVKLVASYCLLELFTGVGDPKYGNPLKLKCTTGYISSIMAVLEGQIFCSDIRVAMNCSRCISIILDCGKLDVEARLATKNNWCRLIVEELAMSLAVSCLASKSFLFHHKPAVHVAVALLKLQNVPGWMTCVFDDSCISGIIKNLSPSNVSTEIVLLFRNLLNCGYLKSQQIYALDRLFQACKKCVNADDVEDAAATSEENTIDDLGKVCEFLIDIMSSHFYPDINSIGFQINKKCLLEEIELFSIENNDCLKETFT